MLIGVFGAVGEKTTRTILAFHMVSQIGYILMGVALFGPLGLTAGIFYLLHHMIVKASLFLSVGAVEVTYGTDRLGGVSGVARRDPVLAVAFFIGPLPGRPATVLRVRSQVQPHPGLHRCRP